MKVLNLLLIKESNFDDNIIKSEFEKRDYILNFKYISDAKELEFTLKENSWDAILCQSSITNINVPMLLKFFKTLNTNIPFIVLLSSFETDSSGIQFIKEGAFDYIFMTDLSRLAPVIQHSIYNNQKLVHKEVIFNKRIDDFLLTISHELNTPLQSILSSVEILRKGDSNQTHFKDVLELAHRNTMALSKQINKLLELSQISSEKLDLNFTAFDLSLMIKDIQQDFLPLIQKKKLEYNFTTNSNIILIEGDANRMRKALEHIIENSIKFTSIKGKISCSLVEQESHVEIIIEDNGQGIDTQFIPYVFNKFMQEDSQSNRKFGGLGIGLWFAKEIIEGHGGKTSILSQGKGFGAKLTTILPKCHPHPNLQVQSIDYNLKKNVKNHLLLGLSGLIIDDAIDTCILAKVMLENVGAKIEYVNSAKQALEKLKLEKPDFILCDINMPEMDGYEFIKILRSREINSSHRLPVAAFTAHVGEDRYLHYIKNGFDEYLKKPIEMHHLIRVAAKLGKR